MDVASDLSDKWNDADSSDLNRATAVDFWPVCRILAEEGLLLTQEDRVATVKIGPFRVAHTEYETATRDFVEVLLPTTITGMASGNPLHAAIAGVLTAASNTFLQLLRRDVIFGRGQEDQTRWAVLLQVKCQNSQGSFPDRDEIARCLPAITRSEVDLAVDWLATTNARPIAGSGRLALLSERDGGYEALV